MFTGTVVFTLISYRVCHEIPTLGLSCKINTAVYKRIHYIANQRDFHVLEINREQDRVHILLTADTITSPAELANVLKTKRPEVPENCTERQS